MRRRLALLTMAVLGVALAAHVWAQPPTVQPRGRQSPGFQGYWMGVDPLDGGDSRRGFVQLANARYAMAGRDSAVTLCDGTDRGYISFDDGEMVGDKVMQSNTLTIKCINNGASVILHARYELFSDNLMAEVTTRPDRTPVTTIVFHKVSQN